MKILSFLLFLSLLLVRNRLDAVSEMVFVFVRVFF